MLIDKRTGQMVIRVVYDGAPQAGKTTNLQTLTAGISLQRRGQLVSPGTTSRRTEFFDWLTFTGGFVDGRRLKCQLVSVPGQPSLLRRRRYLLDTADVVVFVADSRPHTVPESQSAFGLLRDVLARRSGPIPASVVLQANKQDLPESLGAVSLGEALGVSGELPVIGASAMSGDGVMQTFITAVRLGTSRVEAILRSEVLHGQLTPLEVSPEELLEAIRRSEEELLAREVDAGTRPVFVPRPPPIRYEDSDDEAEDGVQRSERPTPPPPARRRRDSLPPSVPRGEEMSLGHVWPLVEGRAILAELAGGRPEWSRTPTPWAAWGWNEASVDDGTRVRWWIHTRPEWRFVDAERAKMELITLVRRMRSLEPWLAPGRALSLAQEGDAMRLWMVTDAIPTLREALKSATDQTLGPLIDAIADALRAVAERGDVSVGADPLDAFGVREGRAYVIALPADDGPSLASLPSALNRLLDELPGRGQADAASVVADRPLEEATKTALHAWLTRSVRGS